MVPTPEQIEVVAQAVAAVQCTTGTPPMVIEEDRDVAREAFLVIAPMVLETAAKVVDEIHSEFAAAPIGESMNKGISYCADRIRALK